MHTRTNHAGWLVALASLVVAAPAHVAAQDTSGWIPMYELVELSNPGEDASRAYAVNDTGQVVGYSQSGGVRHAVHWLTQVFTDLHGTVHFDLKHPYVLYNQDYGEAFDISNADQIVGTARALIKCPDTSFVITNAFLLRPAVLSDLATPYPGDALTNLLTFYNPCLDGYDSAATAISNTSYVVGWSDNQGGVARAFLIAPTATQFVVVGADNGNDLLIDLGTLGGSDPVSSATAVNDAGQVTGYSYTLANGVTAYRAFRLTPIDANVDGLPDTWFVAGAQGENTLMTAVPTLGGNNGWGRGINAAGDVVGESDMVAPNGAFFTHAFLYNGSTIVDLGTLATDPTQGHSAASAINDSGVVVGWAENDRREQRAFVYKDGRMQDLNSLLYLKDADGRDIIPTITLSEARDINENGVIVGWGQVRGAAPGKTRAFMLNPILVDPNALVDDDNGNANTNGSTGNSSGGGTGPSFDGTPIFGPPSHLTGTSDPNAATGGNSDITGGLLALCGFGLVPSVAMTLVAMAGLRQARRMD